MSILVLPADDYAVGHFRLIWPARELMRQGADIIMPGRGQREIRTRIGPDGNVNNVAIPKGVETIVLQRVTDRHVLQAIPFFQKSGIKIVHDLDDDLSQVHANNMAHQSNRRKFTDNTWQVMAEVCRVADVVTVTTPALAARYRPDAVILPNYLPPHYFGRDRHDPDDLASNLMWPAIVGTHPNDLHEVGRELRRVVRETGVHLQAVGNEAAMGVYERITDVGPAERLEPVAIGEWPRMLAGIGVAFVPLADTPFSAAKSWLKVMELSACGVPWVASPRADYVRFHEATGVGLLAEKPKEWGRQLRRLITDPVLRKEQSELGRAAAESYRIRDHAGKWLSVWGG